MTDGSPVAAILAQALAQHRAGRPEAAEPLYRRILGTAPAHVDALFLLAMAQLDRRRLTDGAATLRRLLAVEPDHLAGRHALGKALAALGQPTSARELLASVLGRAPNAFDTIVELANLEAREGNAPAAEALYGRALSIAPGHPGALSNLGLLLVAEGRAAEAEARFRTALAGDPGLVVASVNLATLLQARRRTDEAMAVLDAAIARRPRSADLHHARAVARYRTKRYPEAAAAAAEALRLDPGHRRALVQRARALQAVCDWDALDPLLPALQAEAERAIAGGACELSPHYALLLPLADATRAAVARSRAAAIARKVAPIRIPEAAHPTAADRRLRIGYLCGDMRDHATAHLMRAMFAAHDRSRFAVGLYVWGPDDGSVYRRDIAAGVEHLVDIDALGHGPAAERIRGDGVDLLIDLNGHTTGARLEVAALRPAPVQATYLAFPGTTGADFLDYALVDRIVVPPGHERFYSERLVRLPDSYQINDRDPPCAPRPTRATAGLAEGRPVLACFCGGYKIDRRVFDLWCDILAAAPAALLWLLADTPDTGRNLRAAARRAGIGDRLVLADPLPKPAHLARIGLADLFLDTLTYGAHTTASDALWAGVPVVTRAGEAFASRVGASVVRAHGLPELVVDDLGAYRRLAVALANDPSRLAALKARTLSNRTTMPLFDTARTVRHLEAAYRAMWQRHASGLPPAAIDVPATA